MFTRILTRKIGRISQIHRTLSSPSRAFTVASQHRSDKREAPSNTTQHNQTEQGGVDYAGLGLGPKTAEGAREVYDSWASSYDTTLESWHYEIPNKVAQALKQRSNNFENIRNVIDLGCGTGLSGIALRKAGVTGVIDGVDISRTSLDIALAKPGVYTSAHETNLDTPFELIDNNTYDAAICVGVLSYVERFDVLFKEIARMCVSGGVVVISHRSSLWDDDFRGCQSVARALETKGILEIVNVGEKESYMPSNPDPKESSKTVRIIVFKIL